MGLAIRVRYKYINISTCGFSPTIGATWLLPLGQGRWLVQHPSPAHAWKRPLIKHKLCYLQKHSTSYWHADIFVCCFFTFACFCMFTGKKRKFLPVPSQILGGSLAKASHIILTSSREHTCFSHLSNMHALSGSFVGKRKSK